MSKKKPPPPVLEDDFVPEHEWAKERFKPPAVETDVKRSARVGDSVIGNGYVEVGIGIKVCVGYQTGEMHAHARLAIESGERPEDALDRAHELVDDHLTKRLPELEDAVVSAAKKANALQSDIRGGDPL